MSYCALATAVSWSSRLTRPFDGYGAPRQYSRMGSSDAITTCLWRSSSNTTSNRINIVQKEEPKNYFSCDRGHVTAKEANAPLLFDGVAVEIIDWQMRCRAAGITEACTGFRVIVRWTRQRPSRPVKSMLRRRGAGTREIGSAPTRRCSKTAGGARRG